MGSVDLLKDKKLFRVSKELFDEAVKTIVKVLSRDERILLAIIYGGFIEKKYTRDIDLGIYLADPGDELDDYAYAEDLEHVLSNGIGYPIDIVVLNHVSDPLFNTILIKGVPVLVRDQRLYHGLRLLALDQRRFFYKLSFEDC